MPVVNSGNKNGQAHGWYMEWNYLLAILPTAMDFPSSFAFADACPVAVANVRNRRAILYSSQVVLALL